MRRRLFELGALGALVVLVTLLVLIAMSSGSVPSYAATVNSTNTRVSGIQIMNQSPNQAANIAIDFYNQSGTKVATVADVISPSASKSYYTPNIVALSDGFVGSATVNSDQPVAAILNTQTPSETGASPSDPFRIGSSSGVNAPATTLYFPQVNRNYYNWNSTMYVQNTSSSSASVNVQFISRDGTTKWTTSANIPAYSMASFAQANESALGDNWSGSAVVTSGAPLAGIANLFNNDSSAATSQLLSYNAFSSGSTKLYIPRLVKNYYGFNSGFSIQNIGASSTDVTVTYYMGSVQGTVSHSATIQPNQAWQVYMGNPAAIPAGLPDTYGAAIVTSSSQPIVANVNEDFRGDPSSQFAGFGYTYAAFLEGQQTTSVVLPKISSKYYGYSSGFQVQNVGTGSANISALLVGKDGRTRTLTASGVAPGASWSVFMPSVAPDWLNFDGAATITSNQPIVGMANQSYRPDVDTRYPPKYGDSNSSYNGLNQ